MYYYYKFKLLCLYIIIMIIIKNILFMEKKEYDIQQLVG